MTDPTGQKNTRSANTTDTLTLTEKVESSTFADDDADERGWIVYRDAPDAKGVRNERRIPVQHWSLYARHHNL